MPTAVLAPQARRDVLEATRWIAKDNPTAARGLRAAILKAAQRIGDHPHAGVARPSLADEPFRFMTLTGYPYLIVYDSSRSPPLIVRVLHGARDLPDVLRDLR
jgi:toxin ParE1/3/4